MESLNLTRITHIKASGMIETLARIPDDIKIRVAAYCRVSTDNREQESSYEAQVDYFKHFISDHKNWELVSIYADPGISGKSMKRPEFQRMMKEARDGKIDRILAKSVSRFARNTLDCVACCRELKELGIGVFFEKENIDTMDPSSSFTLTLMASLAEEESRSISSNTKWGMRKKLANGTFKMNCEHLLGYEFDEYENIVINENEAAIVRRIFSDYASGMNMNMIASQLSAEEVLTKFKKKIWYKNTIKSILTNEKYMGDMRLQKTFRPDFLSKQRKNNGEVESYYIYSHHVPIIEPNYFNMVQYLIKKNDQLMNTPSKGIKKPKSNHALSGRIYCGDCGCTYVLKNQDNKDGTIKTWVCSRHFKNKDCPCIPIKEVVFLEALIGCFAVLLEHKNEQISLCMKYHEQIKRITYEKEREYDNRIKDLKKKLELLSNCTTDFDSNSFSKTLDEIRTKIKMVKEERDKVIPSYLLRSQKSKNAIKMMEFLEENEEVTNVNINEAIKSMVDKIVVIGNDTPLESIKVCLYNGETYKAKLINKKKRSCKYRVCYRKI